MVPISDASECDGRCSGASLHGLLWWYVISGAVPLQWSTYHLSRPLPFGSSLKNQSCPPCTTASHYHSHLLTFEFTVPSCSVISPSRLLLIVIDVFCARHCFVFNFFSWCVLLVSLPLSHYCSSMSAHVLYSMWQKAVLWSLCNLHYPTCSFYPLITHSIPLALVVHSLHKLTQTALSPS